MSICFFKKDFIYFFLERRKKETFNQNRIKKQEFKKNEERPRTLQDIFKRSNIQIIGVPEGEEEEQEIEILFEQIMKGTSTIWQRKQTSRESRKLRVSQRSWTQGGTHQSTS